MQHQLFEIEHKPELDSKDVTRLGFLYGKLDMAKSLELTSQANAIQNEIISIEQGSLITTAPMTDDEITIWRGWLPTSYTKDHPHVWRRLSSYNYDDIPHPVLKLWDKHKQAEHFQTYEIWTPENDDPDPVLVGINGKTYHMLARWGESDANLISFDDIKKELKRRFHTNNFSEQAFLSTLVAWFLLCLCVMIGAKVMGVAEAGPPWEIFALTFVPVPFFFHFVKKMMTRNAAQTNPVMQAIAKHDARFGRSSA